MAIYIQHDGFARQSLRRECTPTNSKGVHSCSWCGQRPKRLYVYGVESDGGKFHAYNMGQFCNVKCFRAYYN
jgi:hypothetical protein